MLRGVSPGCRRAGFVAVVVCAVLIAAPGAAAFVYWSGNGIGRANLDGTDVTPGFGQAGSTCGVAVGGGHVYWGVDRGAMGVGSLDGSVINGALVSAPSYFCGWGGIAIDGAHIYWANENQPDFNTIGRANLDGSGVNQRFVSGAINPCGIAVDSAHIYWATGNSGQGPGTTIGRANLDGTGIDASFITDVPGPCGVAVDSAHIYWANMNTGTIGRANLNGTQVNQSFITGLTNPCGVAVDSAHVYWGNVVSEHSSIGRAKLDGTDVEQPFIADTGGQCHVAADTLLPATTQITPSAGSIVFGQDLTFTTTVSGDASTPTGAVQFQVNGEDTGAPVPLDAGGRAGFDPPFLLDVGDTATARYPGNSTYGPDSATVEPAINPARTATSLSTSANPATAGDDLIVVATVSNRDTDVTPFGSVQFFIDGQPVIEPLPLDDRGRVGIIGSDIPAGDYLIRAAYHDDTAAVPDFTDSSGSFIQHIAVQPAGATPASPARPSLQIQALNVVLVDGGHPKLKQKGRRLVVDTDKEAECPAGGPACSVNVIGRAVTKQRPAGTARKSRKVLIGRASIAIPAAHHAKIVFPLNKQGVKLVRAKRRLAITATTTARVGSAPARSRTQRIALKLPKRRGRS